MKKVFSLLLCLILVVGCLPMTALADDTTITGDGETSISLTTGVPELASITVTAPTKTQYNVGDELDTTGMVVMANYNYTDDTPKDVTSAVTLSGFDSSAAGEATVTVSYTEGNVTKTDTFTVTIVEPVVTTYTISVSASPADGGTVTGSGDYEENKSVTVTATANDHYTFVKWTEDGEEVSTSASYTFTVTGNRTLVAVFEPEQVIYTVTVQPGDGTGTAFTVDSTTVISREEMISGNYDQTKGCFYLDTKVYYMFPRQCPFTAPGGKEFDCWQLDSGSTFIGGASLEASNFTITALYKDQEQEPSITLSIPSAINVKYGDTQTAFDIQVKSAVFSQGYSLIDTVFYDSSFSGTAHDGTIPFTVTLTSDDLEVGILGNGNGYIFDVHDYTEFPCTCQGYINITSDAWAAAKPGSYTATLRVRVLFF